MSKTYYEVRAYWQPRLEDSDAIMRRLKCLLTKMKAIGYPFSALYYVDYEGRCFDYDEFEHRISDMVTGRISKGDFNEPDPTGEGTMFWSSIRQMSWRFQKRCC